MAEPAAPTPIDFRKEIAAALAEFKAFSRRGFFTLVGLLSLAVATMAAGVLSLRFLIPNVTYDEPLIFKAGKPADFPIGSTTVFSDKRVVVNRDPDGIYAISMVCTHLGCTVRWFQTDVMFRCPCHGSRYLRDGVRFFGPAPRPLDNVQIALAPDGTLVVDRGRIVPRTTRVPIPG
ncbi:MAG: ubiquinol-cytochrome c reductase iron-sulfur subunit [Candidatus Dormibacteraeota bacterium]|nr:ubiquinol-cytochrome c reductase iron-sulfur subunit [Candidatus Dormibacteraeota bacterium]